MLEELTLRNFKAFEDQTIPFRNLTLLSGLNSSGKSSVIQSLLLLRQSHQQRVADRPLNLVLNGEYVGLGTGRDVFHSRGQRQVIEIGMNSGGHRSEWQFEYNKDANVLRAANREKHPLILETPLFRDGLFQYLSADRLGPRASSEMSDFKVREQREIGSRGEFAAHFLSAWREHIVLEALRHPSIQPQDSTKTTFFNLDTQAEGWLTEVSPGTRIKLAPIPEIDRVQVGIGNDTGQFYRPTNVGFGISYTLPLIVALLSAEPGSLLILENPEAHLHPYGQSKMGELIARAASAGVQVIVETHSDHIVNGIRVAIHGDEELEDGFRLSPELVALHFFQRNAAGNVEIISPELDADGRFTSTPPIYFFDEHRRNLSKLI